MTTTARPAAVSMARPAAVPLPHPGADRGGPVDPAALGRVLLVRPDNIGDVVTAGPVVRALHAVAPAARLHLLTSPAGALVAPLLPGLDGVVEASVSWQQLPGSGAGADTALLERLRTGRYDAMIVLTTATQSPWPAAYLGMVAGIGVRAVHSREFGGAVATHWVTPPGRETHQVDRGLHLLAALGLAPPTPGRQLALDVPRGAHAEAAAALQASGLDGGDPFAALLPGASAPARRYPARRFGEVAASIAAAGLPVRVIGSPAEAALVEEVVAAAGSVVALPPVSVPGLAAVLARATVAVTNNSGGLHLADAVRTPVAATWAGTDPPSVMRPRSVRSALLGRAVGCAPCGQLTCPFDHGCLAVGPDAVAGAALALAAGEGMRRPGPGTAPP